MPIVSADGKVVGVATADVRAAKPADSAAAALATSFAGLAAVGVALAMAMA